MAKEETKRCEDCVHEAVCCYQSNLYTFFDGIKADRVFGVHFMEASHNLMAQYCEHYAEKR